MSALSSIKPLAAAALLCAAGASHAALTVYTSASAFAAAISAAATDTFDGFSVTGITPSPINRGIGSYGYIGNATGGFFGAGTAVNPALSTLIANDPMRFGTFTGGVAGVGGNFFGSDINGSYADGSVRIDATDSLGATGSQTLTPSGPLAGSFVGFVSNGSITALTVTSIPGLSPLWPTLDNLTLGAAAAVPEPDGLAMLLAGIGVLCLRARRRRV